MPSSNPLKKMKKSLPKESYRLTNFARSNKCQKHHFQRIQNQHQILFYTHIEFQGKTIFRVLLVLFANFEFGRNGSRKRKNLFV
jgi:hypothetical protein